MNPYEKKLNIHNILATFAPKVPKDNSELPVNKKKSIDPEEKDEVDEMVERVTGTKCSRCQE